MNYFPSFRLILSLLLASTCVALTPLQITRNGESLTSLDGFHKVIRVPDNEYRLPKELLPYHYEVRLRPILTNDSGDNGDQWTVPSNVVISATCVSPTRNITLHSTVRSINEDSVTVVNVETGMRVQVQAHTYIRDKDFYVITLQNSMQIGQQYSIFIAYVADVSLTSLSGLYRSHYDDPLSGETKYYATTQFQAYGARAAFPCFDEPELKATFDIVIGRRTNYTVLANTPLISTTPIPGLLNWVWDRFTKTVLMPTYLVALIVSDYSYVEASRDLYSKPTRTYGPKFLIDQGHGDFAAEVAAKDLAYYEELFDIDYKLDKMDSAAMWDFSAGAMENWGLNIYREVLLLYAHDQNNEAQRRQIAEVLAHELAHQWFGNLVTCAWWTGAWLNEGFASYVQYLGLNHTNPEFESMKTIQNNAMQNAMRSDVLPDAHPMLLPDKGNPYDTMSYNANLVYSRGAAILRMVENFLTYGTLTTALQKYLKRYAFGAVEQDDLFEALTEQASADNRLPPGVTMKDIMDTWSLQAGYPLLKVRHHSVDQLVTITQEKDTTVYKGATPHSTNMNGMWHVPMAVATQSNPLPGNTFPQHWLSTTAMTIPHNISEWIIVNSGGTGYYRVEYDDVLTQRLHAQLEQDFTVISYGSRSQLLDDYFTRAFTGNQRVGAALGFTKHFAEELEYVVWTPFFFHMAKPYRLFAGSETSDLLKQYILPKLTSVVDKLTESRNITHGIDNLLYVQLMDWVCGMGASQCVDESLRLFQAWKGNPAQNPIPPLLRKVFYCTAIAHDDDNFQFSLERFDASAGTDKMQLLESLGCTQSSTSASLYAEQSLSINYFRISLLCTKRYQYRLLAAADGSATVISKEFAPAALQSIAANHLHRGSLTSFLNDSIGRVVDYYGSPNIISNTIRTLGSHFSTAQDLAFVNNLAAQNSDMLDAPGVKEVIDAAITAIEENILWMARFKDQFHTWLNENV